MIKPALRPGTQETQCRDPLSKLPDFRLLVDWVGGGFFGGTWQSPWKAAPTGAGLATPADFHNVVVDFANTPLADVVQISGAGGHVCALTSGGRVYCWGDNNYGQAGRGHGCSYWSATPMQSFAGTQCERVDVAVPVVDTGGAPITNAIKVVASGLRTFVLTDDGKVYASGYQNPAGGYHFLGVGTGVAYYNTMRQITAGGALGFVIDIATTMARGGGRTCALTDNGELWCWGMNHSGNPAESWFVNGGAPNYPTPVKVADDFNK